MTSSENGKTFDFFYKWKYFFGTLLVSHGRTWCPFLPSFFSVLFFDSFFFSGCDVIRERGGGHRSILKMNWNCPDDDVINLGTIWLVGWWVVTSSTVERLMKKKSKFFFQPILLTSTCRRLSSTRRFESQNWWTFHKERSYTTNFFNFFLLERLRFERP